MAKTQITRTARHLLGALLVAGLSFGLLGATTARAATVSNSSSTEKKITAIGQPKFGEQGANVLALQNAIMSNGFTLRGGASGVFNTATRRALRNFQKVVGLKVTGVVDAPTTLVLKLKITPVATTVAPVATTVAPVATTVAPVATTVAPVVDALSVIPKRGGRGISVLKVQGALVKAGITVRGGTDGFFGSSTAEAISVFQKMKGLAVTSTLTPDTVSALGLSVTTTTTVQPATTTSTTVAIVQDSTSSTVATTPVDISTLLTIEMLPKRGDKNEATRIAQKAIVAAGIELKGGIDGVFGIATKVALTKYQTKQGLSVNGLLDYATALKLNIVSPPIVTIDVFPVQGHCSFVDSWHAARGNARLHLGVDIIATEGQLLYAVADGTIGKVTNDAPGKLSGNALRLVRADGTYFFYAHMKSFAEGITEGTTVKAGQVIGLLGKTGTGTPHLHFEVHPGGGEAVNPYPVVKAIDACSMTAPRVAAVA